MNTGAPAWAEHEVDHRFDVSGTVRAADGTPSAGVKVVVAHPRTDLKETVLTDASGRYSVRLHLHDKDAGDPVTVTAGDETKTIKADYDPKDHHTPRVVEVNFGPVVPGSDAPSMMWWYGAGGVALAGGMIYWLRSRRARHMAKAGRPSRRRTKSHA
jgi:hypothetical protein